MARAETEPAWAIRATAERAGRESSRLVAESYGSSARVRSGWRAALEISRCLSTAIVCGRGRALVSTGNRFRRWRSGWEIAATPTGWLRAMSCASLVCVPAGGVVVFARERTGQTWMPFFDAGAGLRISIALPTQEHESNPQRTAQKVLPSQEEERAERRIWQRPLCRERLQGCVVRLRWRDNGGNIWRERKRVPLRRLRRDVVLLHIPADRAAVALFPRVAKVHRQPGMWVGVRQ